MRRLVTLLAIVSIFSSSMSAQFTEDRGDKMSLLGGSLGMAFPGGESDPELNASLIYLFHKQITSILSFEIQPQAVISTAPSYGDGWKFILPVDCRFFVGSNSISGFVGAGIALTLVSPGDRDYGEDRLNQFAANIALGTRIGFWKERRHCIILGAKTHLPIAQSKGLSDKPVFALIGGIGFNNSWGSIKLDYEYPFGKGYENSVYGINSQAFTASVLFNI